MWSPRQGVVLSTLLLSVVDSLFELEKERGRPAPQAGGGENEAPEGLFGH